MRSVVWRYIGFFRQSPTAEFTVISACDSDRLQTCRIRALVKSTGSCKVGIVGSVLVRFLEGVTLILLPFGINQLVQLLLVQWFL